MKAQCGSRENSSAMRLFLPPPSLPPKEPNEKRANTRLTPGVTGVPMVEKPRTKPRSYTTLHGRVEQVGCDGAHGQGMAVQDAGVGA